MLAANDRALSARKVEVASVVGVARRPEAMFDLEARDAAGGLMDGQPFLPSQRVAPMPSVSNTELTIGASSA